jgi:hypothetical protein
MRWNISATDYLCHRTILFVMCAQEHWCMQSSKEFNRKLLTRWILILSRLYRVFILQGYQMSGELLRMSCRQTQWDPPANCRPFIRWSRDQWVSQCCSSNVTEASSYCALFCVFMAVRCNSEQRVFIYDFYVKKNSYKSWRRKFRRKVPDSCPSGDTISKLVKKVWTNGILSGRKPLEINRVLSEEKLDDIGHRLENFPWKSLRQLARQVMLL